MRLNKLLPGKQLGVTTASWSVVLIYLPMLRIPRALGCNTYLSLWFSFMLSVSAVFVPFLSHPLLSTVYQCDGCPSPQWCGGLWLAGQVLPAIGAVSTLELAANGGSSRMSQIPNLAMQLLININFASHNLRDCIRYFDHKFQGQPTGVHCNVILLKIYFSVSVSSTALKQYLKYWAHFFSKWTLASWQLRNLLTKSLFPR